MVISKPILAISNFSFDVVWFNTLKSFSIKNKMTAEKKTLYQVNKPSLREMSFPKTPVKPASITAKCNNKYDFFIKNYLPIPFGTRFLN